jgi:hypothetical protein
VWIKCGNLAGSRRKKTGVLFCERWAPAGEQSAATHSDKVPVSLLSLELDREAARVAGAIGRARLAADGREPSGDGDLLALLADEVGEADVVEGLLADEVAVGATTLGVDDALGDALAGKVREKVDQVEVAEEERAVGASSLRLVLFADDLVVASSSELAGTHGVGDGNAVRGAVCGWRSAKRDHGWQGPTYRRPRCWQRCGPERLRAVSEAALHICDRLRAQLR